MTQHLDTQTAQLFAHLRRGGNYSYSWAASHAKNADNEPIWKNSTLCNGAGPKEIPPEHHAIHSAAGTALGSYEAWSDVLGRILHGAGFSGFLGNLDALY